MFMYPLEAAKKTKMIDKVYVSSDPVIFKKS